MKVMFVGADRQWWIDLYEKLCKLERSLGIEDGGIVSMNRYEKLAHEVRMEQCNKWESFRYLEEIIMSPSAQEKVHNLRQDVGRTFPLGKWPHPTVLDSWVFLVTEVGEVGDALVRQGYGERSAYVRNNEKRPDLRKELGDVFLMLCTLATHLGVDLDEALDEVIQRLRRKHTKAVDKEIGAIAMYVKEGGLYEKVVNLLIDEANHYGVPLVEVVEDLTGHLRGKYGHSKPK